LGEVGDGVLDADVEAFGDFLRGGAEFVLVPAADHHAGAVFGVDAGHGFAESAATARDEGDAAGEVVELFVHVSLFKHGKLSE
jgi:hypothetical protein